MSAYWSRRPHPLHKQRHGHLIRSTFERLSSKDLAPKRYCATVVAAWTTSVKVEASSPRHSFHCNNFCSDSVVDGLFVRHGLKKMTNAKGDAAIVHCPTQQHAVTALSQTPQPLNAAKVQTSPPVAARVLRPFTVGQAQKHDLEH